MGRMLWRAVLPQIFAVFPFGMCSAYYYEAATKQLGKNVYFYVNLVDVGCSFVSFILSAGIGEASQPERFGRKAVLIWLSVVDTFPVATLHLTQNYRLFLCARFCSAFLGSQLPNHAANAVVSSWITDWAIEEQKVRANSRFMGALYGAFAVAPLLGAAAAAVCSSRVLLLGTLALKLMQPLLLILFFPGTEATMAVARMNRGEGQKQSCIVSRPATGLTSRRLLQAWAFLANRHPRPLLIVSLGAIVGKAFHKNLPLYLSKELHIEKVSLGLITALSNMLTLLLQWYVLPWQSRRPGASSNLFILLGTLAECGHLLAIAASRSVEAVLAVCWLPALVSTCDPVIVSIISRCSQAKVADDDSDIGRDQGLILGALSGLRTLCSCFGTLFMAAWLRSGQPHLGFLIMAMLMSPTVVVAFNMYREDLRGKLPWSQAYSGLSLFPAAQEQQFPDSRVAESTIGRLEDGSGTLTRGRYSR